MAPPKSSPSDDSRMSGCCALRASSKSHTPARRSRCRSASCGLSRRRSHGATSRRHQRTRSIRPSRCPGRRFWPDRRFHSQPPAPCRNTPSRSWLYHRCTCSITLNIPHLLSMIPALIIQLYSLYNT